MAHFVYVLKERYLFSYKHNTGKRIPIPSIVIILLISTKPKHKNPIRRTFRVASIKYAAPIRDEIGLMTTPIEFSISCSFLTRFEGANQTQHETLNAQMSVTQLKTMNSVLEGSQSTIRYRLHRKESLYSFRLYVTGYLRVWTEKWRRNTGCRKRTCIVNVWDTPTKVKRC